MKRFTINFLTQEIQQSRNETGLNLNKKDFIFGFTVESLSLDLAAIKLKQVIEKWSNWVDTYNQWAMLPDKTKWVSVKNN